MINYILLIELIINNILCFVVVVVVHNSVSVSGVFTFHGHAPSLGAETYTHSKTFRSYLEDGKEKKREKG